MDIIILADYCGSFDGNGNNRFTYLADLLVQEHHEVEIVTGDFNHGKKQFFVEVPTGFPYKITMLNEKGYKKNICLQRFGSDKVWGKAVSVYLKNRKKPDVIYAAVPPLAGALEAAQYCEKNGIRFVIDIQDLWPEAFRMVFDKGVISDFVFLPFKKMADGIYSRADSVCAVSETFVKRVLHVNKKKQFGHTVFLGTDLAEFDNNVRKHPFNCSKTLENEIWLAYCGTLGASYDLKCVIDALTVLKRRDIDNVAFMVFGDGPRRQEFENYAREKKVDVRFFGRLPYPEMCGALCACDITVNPIMKGSAASIINKHADYAASGLPVINTQENEEYRNLVTGYKMGFNCENGDYTQIAECIVELIRDENLRKSMGRQARLCAEERFNRKTSYKELVSCIIKEFD